MSVGIGLLRGVLRRGVDRGELRNCPAIDMPEVVMGPAVLAAVWKITFDSFRPLPLDDYIQAHVDLILHGLKT